MCGGGGVGREIHVPNVDDHAPRHAGQTKVGVWRDDFATSDDENVLHAIANNRRNEH